MPFTCASISDASIGAVVVLVLVAIASAQADFDFRFRRVDNCLIAELLHPKAHSLAPDFNVGDDSYPLPVALNCANQR